MVKQGYKQTEVGVIPEDWDCVTLLSKCNLLNGLTYSPNDIANNGLLVLRSSNVQDNQLCFLDNVYVNLTVDIEKLIQKDDIVVCVRNGSSALIGKCAKASKDYNATFGAFMAVLRGKNNDFIFQLLQQGTIQKHISRNSGATINQITNGDFKCILVPFPSDTSEAKRIADALSDVDGMISSLEKLVAKKKAVKQGAMQELLTGKKRLPGFTEEWKNINLSKESKIKARIGWQGLTTNEYLDSGYAYLVTGTDFVNGKIDWDNCHYVAKDRFDQDKNIQIKNDDILITKDGSLGKTALVKGLNKPATLNSGVFVIRPIQDSYDPTFVYYILSSFVFKDFLDHLSAGSTIIHLYQKDINKFRFAIPPTIEEQIAIAAILSDTDNEIEALEQKLDKTRQIKQGMMQQLLTGKIRLI